MIDTHVSPGCKVPNILVVVSKSILGFGFMGIGPVLNIESIYNL